MKTCFKCSRSLPLDAFYAHPGMADGRLNKCKECAKADVRKHREENLERVKAYDRARGSLPHRVALREEYAKTARGIEANRAAKERWISRNPEKRKAQQAVNNAVRDGKMVKPDRCERCGQTHSRIHGHHADYSKPLDVKWVCPQCHRAEHKEMERLDHGT